MRIIAITTALCLFVSVVQAKSNEPVEKVLDQFHQAAAEANFKQYFSLLSENAVFLGTDATERWTKKEFKLFVKPYFEKGVGWTYVPTQRDLVVIDSNTVLFDELLENTSYGQCRGSGLVIKTEFGWQIAQYNLSIPMPNALAKTFTSQIKVHQVDANKGK